MKNKLEELFEKLTEKLLEESDSVWEKPWICLGGVRNGMTNRYYNGNNVALLNMQMVIKGQTDPRFMTFNQIREKKYHLRKGSKGYSIQKFEPIKEEEEEKKEDSFKKGFVKYYTVFNAEDIEGIEPFDFEEKEEDMNFDFSKFSQKLDIEIIEKVSDRAFYTPSDDKVFVPLRSQFENINDFAATFFHELAHSVMNERRLDISSKLDYATEEIIADMSSLFLLNIYNFDICIEILNRVASYINSWKATKDEDDQKDIVKKCLINAYNVIGYIQRKVNPEN